jgi:hypothetical protein
MNFWSRIFNNPVTNIPNLTEEDKEEKRLLENWKEFFSLNVDERLKILFDYHYDGKFKRFKQNNITISTLYEKIIRLEERIKELENIEVDLPGNFDLPNVPKITVEEMEKAFSGNIGEDDDL